MDVCSCIFIFNQEFNNCSLSTLHIYRLITLSTKKNVSVMHEDMLSQWYEFQTHNMNIIVLTDKQVLLLVQRVAHMQNTLEVISPTANYHMQSSMLCRGLQ